ncbi:MAG: cytochrome c oxidase subunit II [Gammaproteobacteria bacterium]|nr:cytochrome c oxidase subunit II [Gammaproteobacteria bacterium]
MPIWGSLFAVSTANAEWEVNLPVGVTDISALIFDLHMFVFWICVAIGFVVFTAMTVAMIKFRKSKGAVPATWSHSLTAEIIWTVIPIMILISMAIPAARALVEIEDTRGTEMTIKITGYQWKWHYDYIGEDVQFFSSLAQTSNEARRLGSDIDPNSVENYLLEVDRQLVLPVDTKIRYLITANDVLHAWWVPAFAVKKDAIPGYINEGWFKVNETGTYRGQCAELCGKDHGFMPVVVKVLSKTDYAAWLAAQRTS